MNTNTVQCCWKEESKKIFQAYNIAVIQSGVFIPTIHKPCLHRRQDGVVPRLLECYHISPTTDAMVWGQLEVDCRNVFTFPLSLPPSFLPSLLPPTLLPSLSPKLVTFLLKGEDDWPHVGFFCKEIPVVHSHEVWSVDWLIHVAEIKLAS